MPGQKFSVYVQFYDWEPLGGGFWYRSAKRPWTSYGLSRSEAEIAAKLFLDQPCYVIVSTYDEFPSKTRTAATADGRIGSVELAWRQEFREAA